VPKEGGPKRLIEMLRRASVQVAFKVVGPSVINEKKGEEGEDEGKKLGLDFSLW